MRLTPALRHLLLQRDNLFRHRIEGAAHPPHAINVAGVQAQRNPKVRRLRSIRKAERDTPRPVVVRKNAEAVRIQRHLGDAVRLKTLLRIGIVALTGIQRLRSDKESLTAPFAIRLPKILKKILRLTAQTGNLHLSAGGLQHNTVVQQTDIRQIGIIHLHAAPLCPDGQGLTADHALRLGLQPVT